MQPSPINYLLRTAMMAVFVALVATSTRATAQDPGTPQITGVSDDRGPSENDGITDDQTLSISGLADANATVTVSVGDVILGTTTADSGGDWTLNPVDADNAPYRFLVGTHIFTALVDGLTSEEFEVQVITKDPDLIFSTTEASPVSGAFVVTVAAKVTGGKPPVALYGLGIEDINVDNGTVSDFSGEVGDVSYTFTVTPVANGDVVITVDEGAAMDLAGNLTDPSVGTNYGGEPEDNSFTIAADLGNGGGGGGGGGDTTAPTLMLSADADVTGPFTVSAEFSEAVNGFTIEDVIVTNGTAGALSGSEGDSSYTFTVAPIATGQLTVSVDAGQAQDLDLNGNTASNQLIVNYTGVDTTAPSLSLSAEANVYGSISVVARFSEDVTGFTIDDVIVTNGTPSDLLAANDSIYTFIITPFNVGQVSASVAANQVQDLASNGNTASNLLRFDYTGITPEIGGSNNDDDDGGCGCTVDAGTSSALPMLLALLSLGFVRFRRREA